MILFKNYRFGRNEFSLRVNMEKCYPLVENPQQAREMELCVKKLRARRQEMELR